MTETAKLSEGTGRDAGELVPAAYAGTIGCWSMSGGGVLELTLRYRRAWWALGQVLPAEVWGDEDSAGGALRWLVHERILP